MTSGMLNGVFGGLSGQNDVPKTYSRVRIPTIS